MIAEVIIQSNVRSLNKIFDYRVPTELENRVKVGTRIFVPFGTMKQLEDGFVIGLKESSKYKLKEIAGIQEKQDIDGINVELAKWMANRYFCNVSDCLKLMLPPGTLSKKIEHRVKQKSVGFVSLKKQPDEIESDITEGKIKSERQIRTLRFVIENGDVLVTDLEMFADTTRAVIKTLCKHEYLEIIEKQVERNPFENKNIERQAKLELNEEQKLAYNKIEEVINKNKFSEFLINGITGSRKNRNILTTNRKSIK